MLPLLLNAEEVRELVGTGGATIRRGMPSGADERRVQLRYGKPGERSWVRERFACRLEADRVRIRYAADGPDGQVREVPADTLARRFRTATYRTWENRYMPRAASRLVVEVEGVEIEGRGVNTVAVVTLRLVGQAGEAEGESE